jgi:hypothetical protein
MAAKETAAVFPLVLAVYDGLSSDRTDAGRRRRWLTVHVPLIAVAVVLAAVRAAVLSRFEYPGQVAVPWPMVLTTADVLRQYTMLLLFPLGQAAFHAVPEIQHPWEPRLLETLLMLAVIAALIWQGRRRAWIMSFGLSWFLLALAPSSLLVLMGRAEPMAEHRVYLASCGLFLAAGNLVQRLWRFSEQRRPAARWLAGTAVSMALAAFALDTMGRNLRWGNPVGLWSEAVQRSPDHFWPRLLLGEALMQSEKPVAALEQFETAVRLAPSLAEPYAKVGICLISVGRSEEARAYLHEALARDPNNGSALQALAWLDEGAGRRSGGQPAANPAPASPRRD